jgi:hypothetical protein
MEVQALPLRPRPIIHRLDRLNLSRTLPLVPPLRAELEVLVQQRAGLLQHLRLLLACKPHMAARRLRKALPVVAVAVVVVVV